MKIRKNPTSVNIELSPRDYWLRENKRDPDYLGEYCLTDRIDMSYADKGDQEGGVFMYLTTEQAEVFKDAGFSEISGGEDPTQQ